MLAFEPPTQFACSVSMKLKTTLFAVLCMAQSMSAQVADFQQEFQSINKDLMLGLGSFAVTNFVVSGIGYTTAQDESVQRFHEMNMMWNTVNLGLAVPGYLKARKSTELMSLAEMTREQRKTERIFLVNSALDLGYIGAGAWMRSAAQNQSDQEALFRGYGNSLIFQGSFLLAFDAFAYYMHHRHAKQLPELERVSVQMTGQGFGLRVALD